MARTRGRSTRSLHALALVLAVCAAACSDDDDPAPVNDTTKDSGPSTTRSLSKAFRNRCATCHGEKGEGANGVPAIPGDMSESQFIATVRSGTNGGMPPFKSTQISDADLKSDYVTLKALQE